MGTLSNSTKVGSKKDTLVLQTSGRVYVNVGSRYYPLSFNNDSANNEEENETLTTSSQIIFLDDDNISSLDYPGDNYLIITASGSFYKTEGNNYLLIPINITDSLEFNSPITITTESSQPPFYINSNVLVSNLNAQYLNGYSSSDFPLVNSQASISGNWIFNNVTISKITSPSLTSTLDLNNSKLSINSIVAEKIVTDELIVNKTNSNSDPTAFSNIQLLNLPTYISYGGNVISAKIYDKFNSETETSEGEIINHNENSDVGGFSIIELIINAYENGFLNTIVNDQSVGIEYYANLLTTSSKGSDLTEDDFIETNGVSPYQRYDFTPKDRSIFATVPYNTKYFCDTYIYDGWFNIDTMSDPSYRGTTYECELNSFIKAGLKLTSQSSNGTVNCMVVGCSNLTARLILTGIDCDFLYEEGTTDYTSCIEAAEQITTSAPIEAGIVLIPNDIENQPSLSLNVIGDITGITNSVYGKLSGYGFSSEGNVYLVNSKIANAEIKDSTLTSIDISNSEISNSTLTNCTLVDTNIENFNFIIPGESEATPNLKLDQTGFLFGPRRMVTGIYSTPWLQYTVNDSTNFVYVGTDTYYFDSTGNARFGTIELSSDGSMTIGKGNTIIHIDANGVVRIPSACII